MARAHTSQRPHSGTLLLTGFGPFPDVPKNATAKLVPDLGRRARQEFSGLRVVTRILPTEWNVGPKQLAALIQRERPVVAVHFGVTNDANGFRIETRAQNRCGAKPDAKAALPPALTLAADGPAALNATIPTRDIVRHLQALGLPAVLSSDAGDYLCNAIFYHALTALQDGGASPSMCGFIHIPRDFPQPQMTYAEALRGSLEIIRICLGRRHGAEG
jgi:pyroglutamyl-peptidase